LLGVLCEFIAIFAVKRGASLLPIVIDHALDAVFEEGNMEVDKQSDRNIQES
jgi:hypothetical protein